MERVLAVLEGLPGVTCAQRDAEPKTVRVRYDGDRLAATELVRSIDRADIRLRAHHRLAEKFRLKLRKQNTARILSDRAVPL